MAGNEWTLDSQCMIKVREIIQNIGKSAQTVEYGDSYYGQVFPIWKETLTYVDLTIDLLKEWQPMLPWPMIYIGFHHDGIQDRYEPILRAWNAANHAAGHTIDINTAGTQSTNIFQRDQSIPIPANGNVMQFQSIKLPGISDDLYDVAFFFGWFILAPLMGLTLQNEHEMDEIDNIYGMATYTEQYDSDGNLQYVQLIDNDEPLVADEFYGWVATTDTTFGSFYTPKSINSGTYPNFITYKFYNQIVNNDEVGIALKGTEFYEKVFRSEGYNRYAMTYYGWMLTWKNLKLCINPRLVPHQPGNPLDKKEPDQKVLEETDVVGGKPDVTYAKDKSKNGPVNPQKVEMPVGGQTKKQDNQIAGKPSDKSDINTKEPPKDVTTKVDPDKSAEEDNTEKVEEVQVKENEGK
jgi:hypothetical protein